VATCAKIGKKADLELTVTCSATALPGNDGFEGNGQKETRFRACQHRSPVKTANTCVTMPNGVPVEPVRQSEVRRPGMVSIRRPRSFLKTTPGCPGSMNVEKNATPVRADPPPRPRKLAGGWGRLVWIALGAALVGGVAWKYGPAALVGSVIAATRTAGPWVFFAGMAILPALGFPLLPFMLAVGPAFVPVMGSWKVVLLAIAALGVNVTLSFWLSAYALGPSIEKVLDRFGYHLPRLPQGTTWQLIFLVRVTPGLPFWTQSYLLGLMRVPWIPYLIVSILVPGLYAVGLIVSGAAAWEGRPKLALIGLTAIGVMVALARLRHAFAARSDAGRLQDAK
jgi:uncharacterized membrane protein YdjX (TVP38/TMEM64 family)